MIAAAHAVAAWWPQGARVLKVQRTLASTKMLMSEARRKARARNPQSLQALAVQPEAALDPQDAQVLESFRQHTPASRDLPLPPEAQRKSRYILEAPSTPFLKPGQVRAAAHNHLMGLFPCEPRQLPHNLSLTRCGCLESGT